jgi:membrane fusion protein
VAAGERLIELEDLRTTTHASDLSTEQLEALRDEAVAISSGVTQDSSGKAAEADQLEAKANRIRAELTVLQDQISVQEQRVNLSKQILNRYVALEKRGYGSDFATYARQDDLEAKMETLQSLRIEVIQTTVSLTDIEAQVAGLQTEHSQKVSEAQQGLAGIARETAEVDVGAESVVRAPVGGTVTGVTTNVGDHAAMGVTMLSIVPDGSRLIAALSANGEAAGLARKGESILLRIDAFPYEQFGLQRAKVRSVTRASLPADSNPESVANGGFVIFADLNSQTVDSGQSVYTMRPGMAVSGDLLLDRKPIIAWLLGPLVQYASSMGR